MSERPVWVSRVVVGVLVLAGVVVAVLTFVIERSPGEGQFHPDGSFVAITENGRLEVRSSETGEMHRLLREDLAAEEFDDVKITVSPDGRFAYHDAAVTRCRGRRVRAIARVDLVRSFTQLFTAGRAPDLSPDGRKLAYLAESINGRVPFAVLDGERPVCAEAREDDDLRELLMIRDIQTHIELRTGDQFEPLGAPIWAGEGNRLIVPGGGEFDYSFVDADTGELSPARRFAERVVFAATGRDDFLVGSRMMPKGCAVYAMGAVKVMAEVRAGECGELRFADHAVRHGVLVGADTAEVVQLGGGSEPIDLGRDIAAAAWLPSDA